MGQQQAAEVIRVVSAQVVFDAEFTTSLQRAQKELDEGVAVGTEAENSNTLPSAQQPA